MLQDGPLPASARPEVKTLAAFIALLLVGGGLLWLKVGSDGYYVLTPGNAPLVTAAATCRSTGGGSFSLPGGQPCVQLVVPTGRDHSRDDSIMMVDVEQAKANPWQYLLYKLHALRTFGVIAEFHSKRDFLGNVPASQLECQDAQQAYQATSQAPVAALRRLGYKVKEEDLGAQIDLVIPGAPAVAAGLKCNDLITAVNGQTTKTAEQVTADLHGLPAGTTVHLTVVRGTAKQSISVTARLEALPGRNGGPPNPRQGFLGIETETRLVYDFPFSVSADVGSIGGPSDGLALALGFINSLSQGRLTGGMKVAATGEIDTQGKVYEIGGAAEKAVAVRDAGAQVFLVPTRNYAEAKREAGSVKVYGVSSLNQALDILKNLGGQIPPVPAGT
jgi:Lon-like protease